MRSGLLDVFREEAEELLTELEDSLLELEENPQHQDAVGRVFRALHTLKGAGGMAGYDELSAFAHEMETIFEHVRGGRLPVSRELVSLALAGRDRLRQMVEAPGPANDSGDLIAALRRMLPSVATPGAGTRPEQPTGEQSTFRIRFRPSPETLRRGIDPLPLLRELSRLGGCRRVAHVDAIPPLDQLDPEACYLYWDVILTTDKGENAIRDVFIFIEDEAEVRVEAIDADFLLGGDAAEQIGQIPIVDGGELSLQDLCPGEEVRPRQEPPAESGVAAGNRREPPADEQRSTRDLHPQRRASDGGGIRVQSEKLDQLVNLIGEMVTVQARLSREAATRHDPQLVGIAEEVERLTWALRDEVLNIRMLPIGTTFSRFRRLVRDLGEELGKEVELTTAGGDTELDKTVIERLYEPLVHLIRNAIDHGLESPDLRRAVGKPEGGRIYLSASHSGATVSIEVRDDGAGIDREALRRKAAEIGLVMEEDVPDRELFPLVFLPGFSTARAITSISGRGVGMEVVKRVLDELGGTVEIASRPGEGTTFTLRLPLTLAIIDGLLVQVERENYVFPLSAVEECVDLRQEAAVRSGGRHLAQVRGELVPYIRLRDQFATAGEPPEIEQIVITRIEGQRVGFVVDHVVGGHQTVIKSLGRMYRQIRGLSGATILGDGTVALILDPPRLVETAERLERSQIPSMAKMAWA